MVELLVVMAVISILIGLTLPAVQMARESARRSQCLSNLHNTGLAIENYAAAFKIYPAGSRGLSGHEHAWSSAILPFLEHSAVFERLDFSAAWDSPSGNAAVSRRLIPVYRCPSGVVEFDGKQDYGGVMGTALTGRPVGMGPTDAYGCGVLIVLSPAQSVATRPAGVIDGLSNTIIVGESVDRAAADAGRWGCGRNCFSQNAAQVNRGGLGDLLSHHPAGAHVLFADGHTRLINESIDSRVLGAACSRNGRESPKFQIGVH